MSSVSFLLLCLMSFGLVTDFHLVHGSPNNLAFRSFLRLRSPDGSVQNAKVTLVRQYRRRPLFQALDPIVAPSKVNQTSVNATQTQAQELTSNTNKTTATTEAPPTASPPAPAEDRSDLSSAVPAPSESQSQKGPSAKFDDSANDEEREEDGNRESQQVGDRMRVRSADASTDDQVMSSRRLNENSPHHDLETTDPFDPNAFMLEHVSPPDLLPGPDAGDEADDEPKEPANSNGNNKDLEERTVLLPFPVQMKHIHVNGPPGQTLHQEPSSKSRTRVPEHKGAIQVPAVPCYTTMRPMTTTTSTEPPVIAGYNTEPEIPFFPPDPPDDQEREKVAYMDPGIRHVTAKPQRGKTAIRQLKQRGHRSQPIHKWNSFAGGVEVGDSESTGPPEKFVTSTKPFFFNDLLVSFSPAGEKSESAAKSVEMESPHPNYLSVSSVTMSPILRKRMRLLDALSSTPVSRVLVPGRRSGRLFSVELLKEEDTVPRPIWYKTHKRDLVDPLDYDYISRLAGDRETSLEKEADAMMHGFRFRD